MDSFNKKKKKNFNFDGGYTDQGASPFLHHRVAVAVQRCVPGPEPQSPSTPNDWCGPPARPGWACANGKRIPLASQSAALTWQLLMSIDPLSLSPCPLFPCRSLPFSVSVVDCGRWLSRRRRRRGSFFLSQNLVVLTFFFPCNPVVNVNLALNRRSAAKKKKKSLGPSGIASVSLTGQSWAGLGCPCGADRPRSGRTPDLAWPRADQNRSSSSVDIHCTLHSYHHHSPVSLSTPSLPFHSLASAALSTGIWLCGGVDDEQLQPRLPIAMHFPPSAVGRCSQIAPIIWSGPDCAQLCRFTERLHRANQNASRRRTHARSTGFSHVRLQAGTTHE